MREGSSVVGEAEGTTEVPAAVRPPRWARASEWLAAAGTAFVLACMHVAALALNFNDKAVHRAMAYQCVYRDDPRITDVIARVHAVWPTGDPVDRIQYCSSYWLPNHLTLLFERLPLYSAFQSVFLAHLTLHLFWLAVVLIVLRRAFGERSPLLVVGLLWTLVPWLTVIDWAFPFANSFFAWHTWRTSYPRGSAILLTSVAALLVHARHGTRWSPRATLGVAFALFAGALLMHREMAVMYAAIGLLGLALPKLTSEDEVRRFFVRAIPMCALLAVAKTVFVVAYLHLRHAIPFAQIWVGGMRAIALVALGFAVLYYVQSRWLATWWVRARARLGAEDEGLLVIGDGLLRLLVPFALLVVALYPFAPHSHEWLDSIVILAYEPTRRIVGGAHFAWFLLAAITWVAYARGQRAWPRIAMGAAALAVLGGVALVYRAADGHFAEVRDTELLHVTVDDVHGVDPSSLGAYRAYHAIANEMRSAMFPSAPVAR